MKKALQIVAATALIFTGTAANAQYIMHVAGANKPGHTGDNGPARYALLRSPSDICKDKQKNLYIADGGPMGYVNDACIRRIDAVTGVITTIAGVINVPDSPGNTADNISALAAKLGGCAAICFDTAQNLLIADGIGSIRKVDMKTGIITTIAGNRTKTGYAGDNGPATGALLNGPCDIVTDALNNIYIADRNNHVIRKVIGATGNIITIAGRNAKGYSGDGGVASNAKFNHPSGLFLDDGNNLFIADYDNNCVRRVSSSGIITTVAGNGAPGFSGDGGKADTARLAQPMRVAKDNDGNLYISDVANQRIRKVANGTNIITTYAGDGKNIPYVDSKGDDGAALSASILPYGLEFDECGNLYVGSPLYSVRVITPAKPLSGVLCGALVNSVNDISNDALAAPQISPNPTNGTFNVNLTSNVNEDVQITVSDITGRTVYTGTGRTNQSTEVTLPVPAGLYIVIVATSHGHSAAKLMVN